MDGIINIIKPPGMTSFDVVAHLRGLLGTRKIGHAGTLDPLAVGVLPVCVGKATRAIEFLMDKDKHYRAELTLGIITDTQDSAGEVLSIAKPVCTDEEIIVSINSFIGIYNQLPPMYSALKVDGKRLYELARTGVEVERQRRTVEIYSADVLRIDRSEGVKVLIDVNCSKGTYIRTLCADIGERLGCGGHMSFLLRKRAGPFEIDDAYTLEELAKKRRDGTIQAALLGVDKVFGNMPCYTLDVNSEKKFSNGMSIPVPDGSFPDNSGCMGEQLTQSTTSPGNGSRLVRVYGSDGGFVAIGDVKSTDTGVLLKVKKFF
jgi:tRNA pseudouridine55 synthase